MTSSTHATKPNETFRPGRTIGIVVRDNTRAKGYVFIKDGTGQEYFAHKTGFKDQTLFDEIQRYEGVSFRISETSKGLRAFDVREIETDEERAELEAMEEDYGNRDKGENRGNR